jgi:hypothetical protein
VSPEGISADPEKLKAVQEWPTPKNYYDTRSFLGLCTYYRRFISGFADIAKPLTKLAEHKRVFQWTSEAQAEEEFIVDTDASNCGIGGVFSPVQEGQEHVIAYYSKTLNKAEKITASPVGSYLPY